MDDGVLVDVDVDGGRDVDGDVDESVRWLCEELGLDYDLKLYNRREDNRLAPDEYKALQHETLLATSKVQQWDLATLLKDLNAVL